jgi:hypothetical protein
MDVDTLAKSDSPPQGSSEPVRTLLAFRIDRSNVCLSRLDGWGFPMSINLIAAVPALPRRQHRQHRWPKISPGKHF